MTPAEGHANSGSHLVYSTDGGRVRPLPHNRKLPTSPPAPVAGRQRLPEDGIVRIQRDKKGRGGKTATLITGLPGAEPELEATLKRLKQSLGTGGTREGRTLIIQGDHRERLMEEVSKLGLKAKIAGG